TEHRRKRAARRGAQGTEQRTGETRACYPPRPVQSLVRELRQLPRLDAAHQLIPFGARKGREVRCFADRYVTVLVHFHGRALRTVRAERIALLWSCVHTF